MQDKIYQKGKATESCNLDTSIFGKSLCQILYDSDVHISRVHDPKSKTMHRFSSQFASLLDNVCPEKTHVHKSDRQFWICGTRPSRGSTPEGRCRFPWVVRAPRLICKPQLICKPLTKQGLSIMRTMGFTFDYCRINHGALSDSWTNLGARDPLG